LHVTGILEIISVNLLLIRKLINKSCASRPIGLDYLVTRHEKWRTLVRFNVSVVQHKAIPYFSRHYMENTKVTRELSAISEMIDTIVLSRQLTLYVNLSHFQQ